MIPKTLLLGAAGLWLLACGCKTAAPRQQEQPIPAAAPAKKPVLGVVEKSAEFYGGQPRVIGADAFRERVDYKSELGITVDTNSLMERIGQTRSVLPALSAEEKAQLEKLSGLSESARQYWADYVRFAREFEAQAGQPMTPERVSNLKQLISTQGGSGERLLDALIQYIDAKHRRENPGANSTRIVQLRQPYEARILGGAKPLNFPALSEFIAGERAELIRRRLQDAEAVRNAGSIHLRMRSSVLSRAGDPVVPLHIRNYDTLQDTDVAQEPRISFKMSDEDRQRLAAENKVNGDIAKLVRDMQDRKSEIRQSLGAVGDALRGDLRNWKTAVTNLDQLKDKVAVMVKALDQAGTVGDLDAALKEVVQKARETFINASNEVQKVRATIQSLTTASNPDADPAEQLMATADNVFTGLVDSVRSFQDIGKRMAGELAAVQGRMGEFKAKLTAGAADLRGLVEAFEVPAGAAAPSTAAAITRLLSETADRYPALLAMLKSLSIKAGQVDAADKLPPIPDDPSLVDVNVLNPPDGAISLVRNIARGDATITLDAVVVTRDETGKATEVTPVHHQEFNVEKFGLINTWSANLIFVKRLGDLGPTEREVQFAPAPSISWTLHYNPPPRTQTNRSSRPSKWWSVIYPGVGLNVSALNFRDNGVQVGVGGHVTLFGDLVIAGAGYNLNESFHGSYVFLGLSIFEGLSQLGVNLPVGR